MAHDALDALAGRLGVAPDWLSGLARCSGADLARTLDLTVSAGDILPRFLDSEVYRRMTG